MKYGEKYLNNRHLNCINVRWPYAKIPKTWYEATVISVFKKGNFEIVEALAF
jgi:hypothetical protein